MYRVFGSSSFHDCCAGPVCAGLDQDVFLGVFYRKINHVRSGVLVLISRVVVQRNCNILTCSVMGEPAAAVTGHHKDGPKQREILSCKFNPSGTSVLATTKTGFLIFVLDREGAVYLQHEYDVGIEIKFAERLYSTNLVAYVTCENPEVFVVFHCKRRKIVCDFRYPSNISVVRFNRQRVIVAVKEAIYIHNVRNMQIAQIIKDLPHGLPSNIMELASSDNCGYLAFPFKTDMGTVRIFDVFQLQDVSCIQAHQSPIAQVKFDSPGYRIATASVRGTCIRVFDSAHGQKLCEFRRGFKEVKMVSLSFSLDNRYLSATSDSETIHIFKLPVDSNPEDAGFLQSVRNTVTTAGGLLNTEERAFLTMPSPLHGQNAIGNFGSLSTGVIHFLLTNAQGLLHIYSLAENVEGSGLIRPVRQVNLQEKRKSSSIVGASNQEERSGKIKKDEFFIAPSNFDSTKTFEISDRVVSPSNE